MTTHRIEAADQQRIIIRDVLHVKILHRFGGGPWSNGKTGQTIRYNTSILMLQVDPLNKLFFINIIIGFGRATATMLHRQIKPVINLYTQRDFELSVGQLIDRHKCVPRWNL